MQEIDRDVRALRGRLAAARGSEPTDAPISPNPDGADRQFRGGYGDRPLSTTTETRGEAMKGLQIRTAMRGLFLTLAFLAVLAVAAQALGATWPHRQVNVATCFDRTTLQVDYAKCEYFSRSYQWQNFILLGFIVEFLMLKAWMMAAMTTAWDWLGSSLIATNLPLPWSTSTRWRSRSFRRGAATPCRVTRFGTG
jgi:hypothetical protein